MRWKEWGTTMLCVVVGLTLFGFGYWLGSKIKQNKVNESTLGEQIVISKKIESIAVPGVVWIKAGAQPICPEDYKYKAKYEGYTGYYYAPDHKNYERVKPVACFADEEFASKTAGFLRKY